MYDVLIIGAGITGCFLAYELSQYEMKVAVIDKENDVACGATMANSAIIHAGNDPEDGTLKAKLNLEGSRQYEALCSKLHVPYKKTGSFTAACGEEEEIILERLLQKARARGIEARTMDGDEARSREPFLSRQVTKVLEIKDTAIIGPWEMAEALMEEAVLNGTELLLDCQVSGIHKREGVFHVETAKSTLEAKVIINAAGVFADEVYEMVSPEKPMKGKEQPMAISPRRGEYFVLDRQKKPLVSRVIYPVPGKMGKGVLAVPTVHGNVLLGPDSKDIFEKEGICNTPEGMEFVRSQIGRIVENIPYNKIIRNFAGLRARGNTGDFIIEEAPDVPGFINVAGIDSPGLSSAPAIASYVRREILREEMIGDGFCWKKKQTYYSRKAPVVMRDLTQEEKTQIILKNPAYGKIVCRCEQISEGEIVAAIRKHVGAVSIKGVKKRVRPGMGRCQGGFCEPEIVKILARELGIREDEVVYDRKNVTLLEEMEVEACVN